MKTLPEVWPYGRPRVLLTDLDDTLLEGGRLRASVLAALESLQSADIAVVAVTGRPASWAEMAALQWPVFGALGENGALSYRRQGSRVHAHDDAEPSLRAARTARLEALARELFQAFPALEPAADARGRISDRAWDIGENVRVDPSIVAAARAFLEERGAKTAVSSIHLHASFERHDKATGSLAFLARELGLDPATALATVPFVGDSGNDRPCFSAFERSVGVANVTAHLGALARTPRYRTASPRSEGFLELARALLAAPA
jgi:HAD superfamily hydrolase (TIGR01484 family)